MADLTNLTDDDLEAMMRNPDKIPQEPAEPEAPEPAPEEVPESAETPAEPPPPEPEAVPEVEEDLETVRLKAVIDELEARQKAMDSKIGRFAGEADFWRKKAEAMRSEPRQEADTYEAEPEVQQAREPAPPKRDGVTQWAVQQAVTSSVNQFESEHPESTELQADIVNYIKESGYDFTQLNKWDDPLAAQREAYRALDEAYWHAKAAKSARIRSEIDSKRTEQFARQKEAKQRASVSGSGGASAPKPPPKTLRDLTDAELDSEMKRLSSG